MEQAKEMIEPLLSAQWILDQGWTLEKIEDRQWKFKRQFVRIYVTLHKDIILVCYWPANQKSAEISCHYPLIHLAIPVLLSWLH